jgi:hypothetical protein
MHRFLLPLWILVATAILVATTVASFLIGCDTFCG